MMAYSGGSGSSAQDHLPGDKPSSPAQFAFMDHHRQSPFIAVDQAAVAGGPQPIPLPSQIIHGQSLTDPAYDDAASKISEALVNNKFVSTFFVFTFIHCQQSSAVDLLPAVTVDKVIHGDFACEFDAFYTFL